MNNFFDNVKIFVKNNKLLSIILFFVICIIIWFYIVPLFNNQPEIITSVESAIEQSSEIEDKQESEKKDYEESVIEQNIEQNQEHEKEQKQIQEQEYLSLLSQHTILSSTGETMSLPGAGVMSNSFETYKQWNDK